MVKAYSCWYLASAAVVLASMSTVSRVASNAPFAEASAYVVSAGALAVAYKRGGLRRFPFWVVLIASYPVINTWLMLHVAEFDLISARAPEVQKVEIMAAPMLAAAIACLFLALMVSSQPLSGGRGWRSNGWTVWTASLAFSALLFFAWLTEPGPFIGLATYEEVFAGRYTGTAFAGGAWAVVAVLSLTAFLSAPKLVVRWIVAGGIVCSLIWLLGHARRSEPMGFLLLAFCLFGRRVNISRRVFLWGSAVGLFALAGYVRDFTWDKASVAARRPPLPFFHLPGAPGNVLIGYIAAWSLRTDGLVTVPRGSTYVGYLLSLPPSFLGWPRPPGAYEIVNDLVPLSGGDYFMLEPVLNFGLVGAAAYLVTFTLVVNWSIRHVRRFAEGQGGLMAYLVGGSFLTMLFRTLWYGLGAAVKTSLMACLIAAGVLVIAFLSHSSRYEDKSSAPSA